MKVYSEILDGYQAEEMAEDMGCSPEEAAKQWFSSVIYEDGEFEEGSIIYSQFVDNIDDSHDLMYNYGADYYFCLEYSDIQECRKTRKVRLTENQMRDVIKESVRQILSEGQGWNFFKSRAKSIWNGDYDEKMKANGGNIYANPEDKKRAQELKKRYIQNSDRDNPNNPEGTNEFYDQNGNYRNYDDASQIYSRDGNGNYVYDGKYSHVYNKGCGFAPHNGDLGRKAGVYGVDAMLHGRNLWNKLRGRYRN